MVKTKSTAVHVTDIPRLPRRNWGIRARGRARAGECDSVLTDYGAFAVSMGKTEVGMAAAHRAVVLDPLNS